MIEVVNITRRTLTISEDGAKIDGGSACYKVTTADDGDLQITNGSNGRNIKAPFTRWTINGRAYPDLPDEAAVVIALDKAVNT